MPYPTGHRDQVRKKIVDSARRLFNQNGFERVSVDSIMANAGLTRGDSTAISTARAISTRR